MELNLKGKVALVTGGSHGLGTAICHNLAAEGVIVGVNYRQSREKAEAVANQIKDTYHVEAMPVPGDMAQKQGEVPGPNPSAPHRRAPRDRQCGHLSGVRSVQLHDWCNLGCVRWNDDEVIPLSAAFKREVDCLD